MEPKINPRELRLGNLVSYNGIIHPIVNADQIHYSGGLEPIPLTPAILEKCGFRTNGNFWYDDGNVGVNNDMSVYVTADVGDGSHETGILNLPHIKYLHQLQNLVHIISGTELNYQP